MFITKKNFNDERTENEGRPSSPSASTSGTAATIPKPASTREKFVIEQKITNNLASTKQQKKIPYSIKRTVDPDKVPEIPRKLGEGSKPLFDRSDVRVNLSRDRSGTLSPKKRHHRRNSSSSSASSSSSDSRHRTRRHYTTIRRKPKSPPPLSRPPLSRPQAASLSRPQPPPLARPPPSSRPPPFKKEEKVPYFLDNKREEERLRRKERNYETFKARHTATTREENRTGSKSRERRKRSYSPITRRARSKDRHRRSRSRSRTPSRNHHQRHFDSVQQPPVIHIPYPVPVPTDPYGLQIPFQPPSMVPYAPYLPFPRFPAPPQILRPAYGSRLNSYRPRFIRGYRGRYPMNQRF